MYKKNTYKKRLTFQIPQTIIKMSSKPVYKNVIGGSMLKTVNIEEIQKKAVFLNSTALRSEELHAAIQEVIKQIDVNMDYFQQRFPYSATKDLQYPIIDNIEWTDGFWTGMLWLAYEYTNDEKYRTLAEHNVESFLYRIQHNIEVDHHDLGFLYSPSCVAAYKLTKSEKAKEAALLASKKLIKRYQEKGEFIQAWGEYNNPDHYRFIIDCMLNIPLLYWASEETHDETYATIAKKHFATSCKYVIREDASAYHTFYMDPSTGEPLRGATRQGYNDDSSWARGQAWGMYGIPLNYKHTHNDQTIPLYKGMANYFLNRLPEDNVCYWDLIFVNDKEQSKDSSAAAIACCGMLEMNKYLSPTDEDKKVYQGATQTIMRSLINHYTSKQHLPGAPVLYHGVYSWHSGKGVDEGNIWGDYYYLEALTRMVKDWNLYW